MASTKTRIKTLHVFVITRNTLLVLFLVACLFLTSDRSSASAELDCPDFSLTDVAAVKATNAAYPAAWIANDSAGVMRVFTPDAVLMPHHGDAPVEGAAAIRNHFWPPNGGYFRVAEFRMVPAEIAGCGSVAYIRGRFTMEYTAEVNGARTQYNNAGNYMMILRKQRDQWLISRYIWDDPAPRPRT